MDYRYENFLTSIQVQHVGSQYTNNFQQEDLKVDPYTVVNGSCAYRFLAVPGMKSIEMKLQVNNFFNLLYAAYGIDEEFFPAAERNFFFGVSIEL
jgi:outer membrane receptor protein involved in Fe transport